MSQFKKVLVPVLKILVAAAIIFYLVKKGALNFSVLAQVEVKWLVLFFSFVLLNIVINVFRWGLLLRGQKLVVSWLELFKLSFIGLFFNYAMPGGVGGDVVKGIYLVKEHPQHKMSAAMSIFMDRVVGFFVMTITSSLAILWNYQALDEHPQLKAIALAIAGLCLCFTVFFAFSLSLRIRQSHSIEKIFLKIPLGKKIQQVYLSLHSYRKCPKELGLAMLISFVSQFFSIYMFYLLGVALGIELNAILYFFIVPAGMIVMALPISPAGVGVGQVAFMYLFNLVLKGESSFGATAITLNQVIQLCWGLVGAIFYIQRKGSHAGQRESLRPQES